MEAIWQTLLAAGIPSLVLSTVFSLIIKRHERKEKEAREAQAKRDAARQQLEYLQIEATLASMALAEATANALKNGHTNGDTEEALTYEREIKHKVREFLSKQGVDNVLHN